MEIKLRCSKIAVTGGGSGIGKAIAKRLIDEGAYVTICGRTTSKLEKTAMEINSERLFTYTWDVTECSKVKEHLSQISAIMGGLDGIVNNAGIGSSQVTGRGYEPQDVTYEEWRTLCATNLDAAFFVMRDGAEFLKQSGIQKGNILNIASNAAYVGISGAYSTSKLAVIKLTHTFAKLYAKDGIIINGIAPGATATPMITHYCNGAGKPYDRHAIGRFIDPDETAQLAIYLMSIPGEIVCGHTVTADGGDGCVII